MQRASAAKACYALLVACVPASMLPVVWLTDGMHTWMRNYHPRLYTFLYDHVNPLLSSWPQWFAVATLAALIAIGGTLYWVGRQGRLRRLRLDRRHVFPALVAGYALWAALSYLWSFWPYGTRAYVIRELPFYFLCGAAMVLCGREDRWITFAKAFVAAAFAEAVLQSAVLFHMAHVKGLTLGAAFQGYAVFYSNRNAACAVVLTAAFVVIGLVICKVHDAARGAGRGPREGMRQALFWTAAPVLLAAFAFIFLVADSLAGKVAAAAGLLAYGLAIVPIKRKRLVVLGVVGVATAGLIAVVASQTLWTKSLRYLLSPQRTTSLRIVDWLTCEELYVRRPVHGWGMGTFPATYAQFFPPLARRLPFTRGLRATHPHSEFARVAADLGMVGLLLYASIWFYALAVSYVALRDRPLKVRLVGYALWAGALAFLVHCAFGKEPMMWSFATNFWLILGVLASASHWLPGATQPGGGAPQPEREDDPLKVRPAGWAVFGVVAAAVAWGWWTWGAGGYASMVAMNRAQASQLQMHRPEVAQEKFRLFTENLEKARARCLWADEVLHDDYVVGWFLARHDQWAKAAEQLERVQRTAPNFLDTRLLLAECYFRLGRRQDAVSQINEVLVYSPYLVDDGPAAGSTEEQVDAYLRRDARKVDAYELLAATAGLEAATGALERHVHARMGYEEDWIVQDYPTSKEVRKLLDFYARAGRWEEAHALVRDVAALFQSAGGQGYYDPRRQVQLLARTYRVMGRKAQAEQVEAKFPGVSGRAGAPQTRK